MSANGCLLSAAAKCLKLKKGKEALALIKASAIVLVTDFAGWQLSARIQLAGTLSRIDTAPYPIHEMCRLLRKRLHHV